MKKHNKQKTVHRVTMTHFEKTAHLQRQHMSFYNRIMWKTVNREKAERLIVKAFQPKLVYKYQMRTSFEIARQEKASHHIRRYIE